MNRISTIPAEGQWFKGNTHAHTCLSDGVLTPADLVAKYADLGYSFTALTDHRIYGIHESLNRPDFLVLPGIELDVPLDSQPAFCHHLVGLGLPGSNTLRHGQVVEYTAQTTGEELAAFLAGHGNLCIYAHPCWSHVEPAMLAGFPALFGMEIYNNTCDIHAACGRSEAWFDQMLWRGRPSWCVASDDTHQHRPDIGGGFIMVKAGCLTQPAIFSALLAGSFYASEAPLIEDFYIADGQARLSCSPCRSIGFLTDSHPGAAEIAAAGSIQEAAYTIKGTESYIRAICTDNQGHRAWTQPIWLKKASDG